MTLLVHYASKKRLKDSIGSPLQFSETSIHGAEYRADGTFPVAGRPGLSREVKREFFAEVTMRDGKIVKVT